ncbi:MAG TPA: substrate-binding domain-containing protein [Ktedonosporobacter sp.]|nr:substrate-binding domain-containing protein [Ktedonosporobacter sp.]
MPVRWNLKQWLAVEHQIYRPSELQAVLEEKAGTQLSLQAISTLLNNVPSALRLSTIQALCNALNCTLSDFCEVLPDQFAKGEQHTDRARRSITEMHQNQQKHMSSENDEALIRPDVDATIRDIVMQTLVEQGLLPRKQEAVSARRATISVLIPGWVWSVMPDLTRGIVETITASTYDLALYSKSDESPEGDAQALVEHFLATPLSAGLVAVFPGHLSSQLTQFSQQGFPVVVIDDQEMQVVPWVGVDNTTGAYMAVQHLTRLGHRRIAHIKGPAEYLVSYARYQGYCRALLEAGLLPDPELILEGDFLPPSGRACASQLFELPPEKRPTAIFAASDQMAYGVLAAAEEFGLSIPKDIALVGFDDDRPSAYTRPPLTTVRQPYFEMGQQGVTLLQALLNTEKPPSKAIISQEETLDDGVENMLSSTHRQPTRVQLQAELVVRESCGANYRSAIESSSEPTIP